MLIRYTLAWLGLMILAIINGASRDALYKPRTGELAAHQISTVVLLIVITIYFILLMRWWPVTNIEALMIGLIWLLLTLAFEFIIGHFVFLNPWEKIFHDYNIFAGRIWVLIPVWVLIAPYIISQFKSR